MSRDDRVKRHKELLPPGLEFSPVRLLGGFICLDTHIGCRGCKFCLNRRQPELHQILENRFHLDISKTGMSNARLYGLISALPSFREAGVPIRIGHLSDWAYQHEDVEKLLHFIPDNYPVTLMTRFPLTGPQIETAVKRPNVIVHITLTPYMSPFSEDYIPVRPVIESAAQVPASSLIFMLRPLISDNESETFRVIDSLPEGSNVCLKGMSTDSIPSMPEIRPVSNPETDRFVDALTSRNHTVFNYFGCALRKKLGIPFFKFNTARNLPSSACETCSNRSVCESVPNPDHTGIRNTLDQLLIGCSEIRTTESAIVIETHSTGSRAEEIYLSEKFKRPFQIATVKRHSNRGIYYMEANVFERWEASGFFPVETMKTISGIIAGKHASKS